MSLNLFIIGPSGCGKSTQAKLIAEKYGLTHLSTGQLFRNEIASASEIGLKAKEYIDRGEFVPDSILIPLVEQNLEKLNNSNFIIDGTPRRVNQGVEIHNYLKEKSSDISLLIHLDVTFEEIMSRRQKRGDEFQDLSRSDNTPEAIAGRQKSYDETINPIKDYFKSVDKLFEVDGNRPIEAIFIDICQKINSLSQN